MFIIFIFTPQTCFANAAEAIDVASTPSISLSAVNKNSQIKVNGENLDFDFIESDNFLHDTIPSGQVTASYEMENPTDEQLNIKMAFPFIGTLDDLKSTFIKEGDEGVSYSADLSDATKRIQNGVSPEDYSQLDIDNILKNTDISDNYKLRCFSEDTQGTLYTLTVKPMFKSSKRRNYFGFYIPLYKGENIIFLDQYSFRGHGDGVFFVDGSDFNDTEFDLSFFITNTNSSITIGEYDGDKFHNNQENYDCVIKTENMDFGSLLRSYYDNLKEGLGTSLPDDNMYNLYKQYIDTHVYSYDNYSYNISNLLQAPFLNNVIVLFYSIEFPPHSVKNVTVSYKTKGGDDETMTRTPVYTFTYLLNPARYWKDFKNLTITIKPPKKAPYIIDSSLPFIKTGNYYTAQSQTLPDKDLYFKLFIHSQISSRDNRTIFDDPEIGGLLYFLIGIAILIVIVIIAVIIRKIYGIKKGERSNL